MIAQGQRGTSATLGKIGAYEMNPEGVPQNQASSNVDEDWGDYNKDRFVVPLQGTAIY